MGAGRVKTISYLAVVTLPVACMSLWDHEVRLSYEDGLVQRDESGMIEVKLPYLVPKDSVIGEEAIELTRSIAWLFRFLALLQWKRMRVLCSLVDAMDLTSLIDCYLL